MGNRSFFKLPILFVVVNFLVLFGIYLGMIWLFFSEHDNDYYLSEFTAQVFSLTFYNMRELFFYFVLASIGCYRARLYDVTEKNIMIVAGIAVIAAIFNTVFSALWQTGYMALLDFLFQYYYSSDFWISAGMFILSLINLALVAVLILFLFSRWGKSEHNTSLVFEITAENSGWIHNVLFTASVMVIVMYFSSYFLAEQIFPSFYYDMADAVIMLLVLIAVGGFNSLFIYFSARRRFIQSYSTLQISKVLKSAGITLGIVLGIVVISLVILGFFLFEYFDHQGFDVLFMYLIFSFVALVVIGYVTMFLSSRFAVRKYFS
ncbi:hypothetical protein [Zophobihabitans entericus]|uniref:Uncharacterized protein n=1 Tax=Zophobihabitans entericus TaxID=1635327 RepID=A0A6G9I9L1_9GAMM|nr:hypothetical protein [Zophobihabitans entericus]QIQ20906.1 hypothetical protein IPMB12_03935 [Zophobihabitans entericus]